MLATREDVRQSLYLVRRRAHTGEMYTLLPKEEFATRNGGRGDIFDTVPRERTRT